MRRERPGLYRVIWDGTHLTPTGRYAEAAREGLRVGVEFSVEVVLERSIKSHGHYFASVNEGWKNLSDEQVEHYFSPKKLRTQALIETGWATHSDRIFDSPEAAAIGADLAQDMDPYCIAVVRGNVLRVFKAVSQAVAAMDREDFQKSKDDVLGYISGLLQVSKSTLEKNAGKSA